MKLKTCYKTTGEKSKTGICSQLTWDVQSKLPTEKNRINK